MIEEFLIMMSALLCSRQNQINSTHTDCNYSMDIRGCQKGVPQVGRVHFCPFHSKMELRLYCNICREVLCESCKHQQKHDSHIDQIGDITEEAVALRQRLKVRMEKFVPEGKTKEVDKSLEFAGDLLKAFESERTSQVTLNKRLIDAVCNHQHQVIKKRKQELICGAEQWRKQLADLHAKCSTEYSEACEKAKHEKCLIKAVSTNQDLLKIHPYLNKFLASTGTSILQGFPEKCFSLTSIWKFACLNLTDLEGRMSTMGVFLDDNHIDNIMSFKRAGTYVMFKGEQLIVTALVRTRRGQPVPEAALKDSNIKIFASKIEHDGSMAAPVRLPTSGYGEGEMYAFFRYESEDEAVFLLEIRLETHGPSPVIKQSSLLPDELKSCPSRTRLFAFKTRASFFDSCHSSPSGYIRMMLPPSFDLNLNLRLHPYIVVRQVKGGSAFIRALKAVGKQPVKVDIHIAKCTPGSLDIGFTWDYDETNPDMKLVLATSAEAHSSHVPCRGCVAGETISVHCLPESRHSRWRYQYSTVRTSPLTQPMITPPKFMQSNKKPTLALRMHQAGTTVFINSCAFKESIIFL
eukprot:scpid50343/ scgid34368/ 